jgi:hypothetical protein
MSSTLGTAAKACGINKTDNGNWSVEPVELFRVFPPVATEGNVADNVAKQRETTRETTARLDAEIESLTARLDAGIESLKATETLLRTKLKDTRHQLAEIYAHSLFSFVSPPFP